MKGNWIPFDQVWDMQVRLIFRGEKATLWNLLLRVSPLSGTLTCARGKLGRIQVGKEFPFLFPLPMDFHFAKCLLLRAMYVILLTQ